MSAIVTLEAVQKLSKKRQAELRSRCQVDLFYLTNNILRASSQLPLKDFHQQMCQFLPQCSPVSELPMENWSEIKERVLLSARGTLKSTILSAHLTQVILCNPNVRIMLIAGNVDKAHQIIDLVRAHLQHPVLAHLFPEHQGLSKGDSFTTPARSITLRDATLFGGSFRTINAGAHAEYICLDDAATELAHRTQASIQKTIDGLDDLSPVLEAGGYLSFFGTRWSNNDLPAIMFERAAELEKQTHERTLECLELPAWSVKAGHENNQPLTADDVDLLWPEKLTFTFLNRIFSKTPNLFKKQYLLQVEAEAVEEPEVAAVNPQMLHECLTKSVDYLGDIAVINADLSSISPRGTDCTALIGGYWNPTNKVLTVTQLLHRKFVEEHDFLRQTKNFYNEYSTSIYRVRFRCENNRDEQQLFESKFNLQGTPAEFLPSLGSKYERVAALWTAIRAGRIKFAQEMQTHTLEWQTVVQQVCGFSGVEGMADDAVDALAGLWIHCQTVVTAEPSLNVPDFGDEAIQPFACRPCNTVKIRRPDTIQPQHPEYSDPAYGRMFSVNKYNDTPL